MWTLFPWHRCCRLHSPYHICLSHQCYATRSGPNVRLQICHSASLKCFFFPLPAACRRAKFSFFTALQLTCFHPNMPDITAATSSHEEAISILCPIEFWFSTPQPLLWRNARLFPTMEFSAELIRPNDATQDGVLAFSDSWGSDRIYSYTVFIHPPAGIRPAQCFKVEAPLHFHYIGTSQSEVALSLWAKNSLMIS